MIASLQILLGDMPAPTKDELGTWITVLAAILGVLYFISHIAVNAKKFFEKKLTSEEQFVTKQELQCELKVIGDGVAGRLTKVEDTLSKCASTQDLKELQSYTRQSFHDMRDAINPLALAMEAVKIMLQTLEKQMTEHASNAKMAREATIELKTLIGTMRQKTRRSDDGNDSSGD